MFSIQLLISILVLIFSIISAIVYYSQRADTKAALQRLRERARPIRSLKLDERAPVEQFQVDPHKRTRRVERLGESVYRIEGAFARHGISVSGAETVHDTIGGVEVVLPYDAATFLEAHNVAEVVLTPKFAIVLRLNDAFDIRDGYTRTEAEREQKEQWEKGAAGELPELETPVGSATEQEQAANLGAAHIMGRRDETAPEAATRRQLDSCWFAALAAVAAFGLLLVAANGSYAWLWLLASAALFALGHWLFWRWRLPMRLQPVNRVRGHVVRVEWRNPHSQYKQVQLYAGANLPINVPKHWQPWIKGSGDSTIDFDVRVKDRMLLRYGDAFSLADETTRFPRVKWGGHLLLALIGAGMLATAWVTNDRIELDLAHVRAAFSMSGPQLLTDVDAVRAQPPALGSLVNVQAEVRCRLPEAEGYALAPVDCRRAAWGSSAPEVAEVALDQSLIGLYDGELVKAERDRALENNIQIQHRLAELAAAVGQPRHAPPMRSYEVRRLWNVSELILAIDEACLDKGQESAAVCRQLKDTFRSGVELSSIPTSRGWGSTVDAARSGEFRRYGNNAVTSARTAQRLTSGARELAEMRIYAQYEMPLRAAMRSQRDGVVLFLSEAEAEKLRRAVPRPYANAIFPSGEAPVERPARWQTRSQARWATPYQQQWAAYQTLATDAGVWSLQLTGMVTGAYFDENDALVIEIAEDRTRGTVFSSVARLTALLVGLLILLIYGTYCVINVYRATQRKQALKDYYTERLGQPPASA
ncbi:hypothetical protein CAI21_19095 [Alkalilimnicola ehrlichii]|uniref:Intracellular growth attenuator IgaA n=1 Tax=Alkalilimnicola ehrlichii TaxID=351052 RepID=A0A3E0WKU9_9GAMM|nr:IgaA/UmoB family intracellular growth attenuator [Alkalilimnicola ehrlichii]RFA25540.1 hypothetical protein CAI21_19095 [Alkalilimnicola ehrlichii]RFA32606.1 hypothetical protein CAL65_19215 [Alkalilimnicola ehrlichii]